MSSMPLTPAESRLKALLQFWMLAFLGSTVVFCFFGKELLNRFNQISSTFFPTLPLIALPQEKFWLVLTLSLMVTLIFLCYWGQKNIQKNISALPPILISKFTSTFFFFVFFLMESHSLAYFIGMLVDGSVFLITYYFYKKVRE